MVCNKKQSLNTSCKDHISVRIRNKHAPQSTVGKMQQDTEILYFFDQMPRLLFILWYVWCGYYLRAVSISFGYIQA